MIVKISSKLLIMAIIVTVCVSMLIIWGIAADLDKKAKANLMAQAKIAAHAINIERLKKLGGDASDLNLDDYSRIKQQLYNIRLSSDTCRFLYILGMDGSTGNVFFFVDSQLPDTKDYAPPGLVYDEVSDEFRAAVEAGQEAFVGPVTDRWGTLVTALVPLTDPESKEVIAMLGMDVSADDWQTHLLELRVLPVGLTLLATVLIVLAVSLKLKTNELRKTVKLDSLTQLYSRKMILEYAESELARSLHHNEPFSIIVLDVDNFKQVNDQFGHQTGDAVLREIAACFKQAIRKTDLAGRIGGEEFIILLPYTNEKNAVEIAEKIRMSIQSLQFEGAQFQGPTSVSASFGVSSVAVKMISFEKLYEHADKALYLSKHKGKNRVSVYTD